MERHHVTVIFLTVTLAVAGCTVDQTDPSPQSTLNQTSEEGEATPVGEEYTVTVTNIVDGDTIDIRYKNGTTDTVRLLGVDTPEVYNETDPGEWEGIPETSAGRECLERMGQEASEFATANLAGETVIIRFDSETDRRGYYDRLLAYVIHDGQNFNYQLVARGYARVYDSSFTQSERFYEAESRVRENRTQTWSCQSVNGGETVNSVTP